MRLLRILFIVWFVAAAPLTAAAGQPCAHHHATPQTAGHHGHGDAASGHPTSGVKSATAHAHHAMPAHGGQVAQQDHSQHAATAAESAESADDCCKADCCEAGGACSGTRCATAPGVLVPAAAPHNLPNRGGRAPFLVARVPDPAPGHPRTLLRPPA